MLKLKRFSLIYDYGDEKFLVSTVRSFHNDIVSLEISAEGDVFSAVINAKDEIEIRSLSAAFENEFGEDDKLFLNGYQSWTDSHECGIHHKMRGIDHIPHGIAEKYSFSQYGDYNFADYSIPLHGWSYGYIRRGNQYSFIGSLAEDSGFTEIRFVPDDGFVTVLKDCSGLHVSGEYTGLRLLLKTGGEAEVFDEYFDRLGVKLRSEAKPVFGYTSWYRHYQNISEPVIAEDLAGLKAQQYKADIFQIDDGYQTAVGDWLSIDHSKFPGGMKAVADNIRSEGMLPGIWLAPFVCEERSDIYQTKKHWLVQDENGNYVKGGSNWSGFYALDFYNDEVRSYLRNVFSTIVDQWGYGLLKLDFLYAVCIQPRPDKTRGQIMAEAMEFLRDCAGDAFILGCGVPLASAFGRVDYCRIGCDVSLDWDDKPYMRLTHRERVSTKNTVLNSIFRRQLDGRAFLSDPDVFILRRDNTSMTTAQKKCLAEINSAAGSVLFTSDNAAEYDQEQLVILNGIMKLRGAEILSADLAGNQLTVRYKLGEKTIVRNYHI